MLRSPHEALVANRCVGGRCVVGRGVVERRGRILKYHQGFATPS